MPNEDLESEAVAEDTCECASCGNSLDHDHAIDHDGEPHCEDCVATCEGCSETFLVEDLESTQLAFYGSRRHSTESRCESCRFTCADCDGTFAEDLDSYSNADGERVCASCGENYYTCDECGDTLHSDDVHHTEDGDGSYCEGCLPEARGIHDYSYQPRPVFQTVPGEGMPKLFFGVEVEVDNGQSTPAEAVKRTGLDDHDAFYCKRDGSLENGFEIVSHPGSLAWWLKADLDFCDKLKTRHGYRSYDTTTCGMHIHVSKAGLTKLDELKLLEFFSHNATFIGKVSRRKPESLKRWAAIDGSITRRLILKVKDGSFERYEAINLTPRKTVEFRIFRGTLCTRAIRRNIAFVATLIAFVKQSGRGEMTQTAYLAWLKLNASKLLGRGEIAKGLISWIASL